MPQGTYSTRVADYFGLNHIASGDLVRDEMRKGSEIGKEVGAKGGGGAAGGQGGKQACGGGSPGVRRDGMSEQGWMDGAAAAVAARRLLRVAPLAPCCLLPPAAFRSP